MAIRQLIPVLPLLCCVALGSCKKELSASGNPTTIELVFTDKFELGPLVLGTTYVDPDFGEPFSVSVFKYYISNVQLISKNGATVNIPSIYHLVDAADTTTGIVSFPAAADSLVAISFLVGVDSTRDLNGPRTGDLDPAKGMFLSPSAGYIMADLEGSSPASTQPGFSFTYKIEGFNGPDNTVRKVTLALPGLPVTLNPILPDTVQISIDADLAKWFSSAHDLPINPNSVCITPGPLAAQYADNYAQMFIARNVQVK